jgi:hypothetical protein
MRFNPSDWYWFVGGNGPHIAKPGDPFTSDETKVFSSARQAFVPVSDATYQAWMSAGKAADGYDPTTRIDSEANLADVLAAYGITMPASTIAQAIALLATELQTRESAGVFFTPTSATAALLFPTTADAIGKYTAEWSALGTTPPLRNDGDPMIAADGTPVALSNADAKAVIQKALAYFRACTANYATLHAAVVANPSADITVGWPTNT